MLRKDFPLAPWEIYESRAAGADAVLLIAAVLDPPRLEQMLEVARELGMTALVEVHERAACPLSRPRDLDRLGEVDAVLVGEALVRAEEPERVLREMTVW